MKCTSCGCDADPNAYGRCSVCDAQMYDPDDGTITGTPPPRPAPPVCFICAATDGRKLRLQLDAYAVCEECRMDLAGILHDLTEVRRTLGQLAMRAYRREMYDHLRNYLSRRIREG